MCKTINILSLCKFEYSVKNTVYSIYWQEERWYANKPWRKIFGSYSLLKISLTLSLDLLFPWCYKLHKFYQRAIYHREGLIYKRYCKIQILLFYYTFLFTCWKFAISILQFVTVVNNTSEVITTSFNFPEVQISMNQTETYYFRT